MSDDSMAVDAQGRPLPYTPAEVDAIARRALDEGQIVAAIIQMPNGDLTIQVMGPPTEALLAILEQTAAAYRVTLKGH